MFWEVEWLDVDWLKIRIYGGRGRIFIYKVSIDDYLGKKSGKYILLFLSL